MIKLSIVLVLLTTILTSCISPGVEAPSLDAPPIGDGGLITGQPCASPCFFGIRVGETLLSQVVSELEKNGISSCTQDVDSVSCGLSIFVGVHSPTSLVDSIGYSPSVPVSVEDVIEKYGDPDLIQVFPGDSPELIKVSILLFWDSIHMRIHLPEKEGSKYVIEKSTYITWVTFFDEIQYSELSKNTFSQSWRGYNTYQLNLGP